MSENETVRNLVSRSEQPLVVRHGDGDFQHEVLERLSHLETVSRAAQLDREVERGSKTRFDPKVIAAIGAIFLSIAGYVIQDARNSSRQDAEIETTKVRLTNLERIATTNTEARIRTEVQLGELQKGQGEIKEMIEHHESDTLRALNQRYPAGK
jgi:hypothetical protein